MNTPDKSELDQFTGTTKWYKYFNLLLTDGAKYVADTYGAWWLIDIIVTNQEEVKNEKFQVWKLTVNEDKTGSIVCEDGNYDPIHKIDFDFTDFPWNEFVFWCINKTVLLPSEY